MSKKPAPRKKSSQAEGSRASLWTYDPFELVIIGLDTKDGESHYLYDAESLAYDAEHDDAMIANVRKRGVLKPVLIERDGDRNLVVDGRSRVRWARCAAKLQKNAGEVVLKVRCVVTRGKPAEIYGISRAAQRHRPDDSDLAQARQLQRMIDMIGSEDEAATELAITPLRAKKLLALLTADPKVQAAVARGMGLDAAAKLAKLPREQQVAKLAEIQATGEKPTARAVTNKLREGSGRAPVETAAQKLRKIDEAITEGLADVPEATRNSLSGVAMSKDPSDVAVIALWVTLTRIRAILHPQPNGAVQPAAQEAEFGA